MYGVGKGGASDGGHSGQEDVLCLPGCRLHGAAAAGRGGGGLRGGWTGAHVSCRGVLTRACTCLQLGVSGPRSVVCMLHLCGTRAHTRFTLDLVRRRVPSSPSLQCFASIALMPCPACGHVKPSTYFVTAQHVCPAKEFWCGCRMRHTWPTQQPTTRVGMRQLYTREAAFNGVAAVVALYTWLCTSIGIAP